MRGAFIHLADTNDRFVYFIFLNVSVVERWDMVMRNDRKPALCNKMRGTDCNNI